MKKIPTDVLIAEIHRLANGNSPPSKNDMENDGEFWPRSYELRFGSWNNAVKEAGYRPNRNIPQEKFYEEPDRCPLCLSTEGELDFHHWRYGDDPAGCYLCRGCHNQVHTRGAKPSQSADWLLECVNALAELHNENHPPADAQTLADRYNLPTADLVSVSVPAAQLENKR
jgi:hypothetical protein